MKLFVRGSILLGLAFALVTVWIAVARTQRPSEKTVATFLETVQLEEQSPAERAKTIRRVARMFNLISPEERAQLESEGWMRKFQLRLSPGEQKQFFVKTHPASSGE